MKSEFQYHYPNVTYYSCPQLLAMTQDVIVIHCACQQPCNSGHEMCRLSVYVSIETCDSIFFCVCVVLLYFHSAAL